LILESKDNKNVIISTGTASGKSLTYQIPIINSIFNDPEASSLLLFPTKALAADQNKSMQNLLLSMRKGYPQFFTSICAGLYDGDISQSERSSIRKSSNIIISNPDMLHIGILPHHPTWEHFFSK